MDTNFTNITLTDGGSWTLKWVNEKKPNIEMSKLEDCEIILNPKATIVRDRTNKGRKAVVKKCSLDENDLEKAFMYAFLKMHGITPKMIQKAIDKAVVQKDKEDEK